MFIKVLSIEYVALQYWQTHQGYGNLHIIFADGNYETSDITFCYRECMDKKDVAGRIILDYLFELTPADRKRFIEGIKSE